MAYEDFTAYTEVDTGANRIQFTGTDHVDHRAQRNESTYLYDDKGAGHFGNFEHLVDVESNFEDNQCNGSVWQLTDAIGERKTLIDASESFLFIQLYQNGSAVKYIYLNNIDGGVSTKDGYICAANTRYYLTIERNNTTGTCKIYSDSDRLNLLDTLTLTLVNDTFRYVYGCSTYNSGDANRDSDNIIENLDLQEDAPETHNPSDTAKSSDALTFKAEVPIEDTAKASDSISFFKGLRFAIGDTAKASDDLTLKAETDIEDTAKASDDLTFQAKTLLSDTAKASDDLTLKAEITIEDTAKTSDSLITKAVVTLGDTAKALDSLITRVGVILNDIAKATDKVRFFTGVLAKVKYALQSNETKLICKHSNETIKGKQNNDTKLKSKQSNE
jgi:hypothetical protein